MTQPVFLWWMACRPTRRLSPSRQTNATEGVGLLQVADGALSQVTSLLNRAVTLATEASNGTLNSSQDTAANQEYQSILSEISNIGSTTTYNDAAVFGKNTNIYTGDSSTTGSSIDALNIRTLSSSNVGDSAGVMAYSAGANNVFINLSSSTTNAQATDTLNQSGSTTIDVNYLLKGTNGAETSALATISVGGNTSFSNTANGLISAINGAGLGLTASFTTAAQAGVSGGTTQTGIQITGGAISVGVDPNTVSTSGVLNPNGITNENFNLGQTITVTAGGTTAASFVIGSSTNTLAGLAQAITDGIGAGAGAGSVTASVITNGNGSQSVALSDAAGGGVLAVNVSGGQGAQSLSNPTSASPTSATTLAFTQDLAGTAGTPAGAGSPGSEATGTLTFHSGYTASNSTPLSGNIVLSNATGAANPVTFTMGGTVDGTISVGNTLQSLASAISSALGVTATVTTTGLTMTSNTVGTTITMGASALTTAENVNVSNIVNGVASTVGSQGTTTLSMANTTGAGGSGFDYASPGVFNGNDTLTGGTSIVLQNGTADSPGTADTFVIGGATNNATTISVGNQLGNNATLSTLLTAIQSSNLGIGNAAVNSSGQIVLTSTNVGTTISMGAGTNLEDQQAMSVQLNASTTANAESVGGNATIAIAGLTSATTNVLAGSIVVNNGEGGAAETFVMGNAAYSGGLYGGAFVQKGAGANSTTYSVNGNTMADLKNAINDNAVDNLGITATDAATGITLAMTSGTAYGSSISVVGTGTLTDNYATSLLGNVNGNGTIPSSATLAMTANGASNITTDITNNGGGLSGTLVLSSNVNGVGAVSDTFVMGNSGGLTGDTSGNTWDVNGNTVAALRAAINDAGGAGDSGNATANLDLSATVDPTSGGLVITSTNANDTLLSTAGSTLTANIGEVGHSGTQGQVQGGTATGFATGSASGDSTITFGGSGTLTASDALSHTGSVIISNGIGTTITFAMGAASSTINSGGHTTITTNGYTLGALQSAINGSALGITAQIDTPGTGLQLSTTAFGTSISVANGTSTITDNYATQFTTPASGGTAQYQSADLDLANGGSLTAEVGGKLSGTLYLSMDVNGTNVHDTFVMQSAGTLNQNAGSTGDGVNDNGQTWDISTTQSNLAGLEQAISDAGSTTSLNTTALDVSVSGADPAGGIFIQANNPGSGGTPDTNLYDTAGVAGAGAASTLTYNAAAADASNPAAGHLAGPASIDISNIGTNNQGGDTVTGNIVLSNTAEGVQTTFTMGGASGQATGIASGLGTQNIMVSGTTLNNLVSAIDNAGLDLTANVSGAGLGVTSSVTGSTVTAASALVDQYTASATVSGGTAPGQATDAVATLGTGVNNLDATANALTGAIVISNNNDTDTFTMATSAGTIGVTGHSYETGALTATGLAQAINADTNLDISATVKNGLLNLESTVANTSITFGTNSLSAAFTEGATLAATQGQPITSGASSTPGSGTTATFALGAGSLSSISSTDVVTGSISITANGNPAVDFHMGATATQVANDQSSTDVYIAGNQLSSWSAPSTRISMSAPATTAAAWY